MRLTKREKLLSDKKRIEPVYVAAKADQDVVDLMKSFCHKYRQSIPADAAEDAAERALQLACCTHDPDGENKFTNSLYRYLQWEFNRACVSERRQSGPPGGGRSRACSSDLALSLKAKETIEEHPADGEQAKELVLMVRKFLPKRVGEAIILHYLRGYSHADIAHEQRLTVSAVRDRVKFGIKRLQEIARDE